MFKYLKQFALLSLASGSYKYLKETGLLNKGAGEICDVTDQLRYIEGFGEVCKATEFNIHAIAALGSGVIIWFLIDTFVEYDENGIVTFGI